MALSAVAGRWGTECSVPVRLASVMAHLGSYEEILAHVFNTSVLSCTRRILHKHRKHTSRVILAKETVWNRAGSFVEI